MGELIVLDSFRLKLNPLDLVQCPKCQAYILIKEPECEACLSRFSFLPDVECISPMSRVLRERALLNFL